jgi:hypothetical protein
MKFRPLSIMLAAITLTILGCSKKAETTAQKTVDLGVVELNNGVQNRLTLPNGTICIVTPKTVGGGQLMLDMQIEKSGAVVASPRAEATPDQPVTVYLDDSILKLTPHLK